MICDAHVHMGYYARRGCRIPAYYSPRRILSVLDRCNVDEFVVSSTCAQITSIPIAELNREAKEMKRIAGKRAHVFLWVSGHVLDEDPRLDTLEIPIVNENGLGKLYEGIKLHEGETAWVRDRSMDLFRILSIANERSLPVQFHSGKCDKSRPLILARWAEKFPNVRFDFAHCPDMNEISKVISDHSNVWTDTAYLSLDDFVKLREYDWHGRLQFGTDIPVWQAYEKCSLTRRYREYVSSLEQIGFDTNQAFSTFVSASKNAV